MKDLEVSDIIEYTRKLNPKGDFDSPFTFCYDETNNIGRFYVSANDFNAQFRANFILGGLAYDGAAPKTESLIEFLRLQKTARELKFKHVASGDFPTCLTSWRLTAFLKFVYENNLYVHYSSFNILYWSIVDIVDSAIMEIEYVQTLEREIVDYLKNDLYKLAVLEVDSVIDLFFRFGYPNIKPSEIIPFIDQLIQLFDAYIGEEEFHFGLGLLRQILGFAKRSGSLPFIMDEDDHVLLRDFSQIYLRPIYSFKSSTHIFDRQDSITKILNGYRVLDKGVEVNNYSFVDSQDNPLIQLSDVFVGLMGKFTFFRNTHSIQEITSFILSATRQQLDNLALFLDLLSLSNTKNPLFLHSVDSRGELAKINEIFSIMGKRL